MAQNLGDVVELQDLYAENGYIRARNLGELTSYTLIANQLMTLTQQVALYSYDPNYPSNIVLQAPKIVFSNMSGYGIVIYDTPYNSLTFNDASVNFDNAQYNIIDLSGFIGKIGFTGTSSINITSNTNGKTLIKATTLTGTITLDAEDGVQDGDSFSIEATDNQLVITDGEWIATPSTSGNITTYTLTKATLQKPKFRLLYTIG